MIDNSFVVWYYIASYGSIIFHITHFLWILQHLESPQLFSKTSLRFSALAPFHGSSHRAVVFLHTLARAIATSPSHELFSPWSRCSVSLSRSFCFCSWTIAPSLSHGAITSAHGAVATLLSHEAFASAHGAVGSTILSWSQCFGSQSCCFISLLWSCHFSRSCYFMLLCLYLMTPDLRVNVN